VRARSTRSPGALGTQTPQAPHLGTHCKVWAADMDATLCLCHPGRPPPALSARVTRTPSTVALQGSQHVQTGYACVGTHHSITDSHSTRKRRSANPRACMGLSPDGATDACCSGMCRRAQALPRRAARPGLARTHVEGVPGDSVWAVGRVCGGAGMKYGHTPTLAQNRPPVGGGTPPSPTPWPCPPQQPQPTATYTLLHHNMDDTMGVTRPHAVTCVQRTAPRTVCAPQRAEGGSSATCLC